MSDEFRSEYEDCLERCENLEQPGLSLGELARIDFSNRETTVDQQVIEASLDRLDLQGKRLLHVGVGNSQLAVRFHKRLKCIDGLTVSSMEKSCGDQKLLPNYRVYLVNKYRPDVVATLANRYDFIIDNNLAGFACCKFHFSIMLANYAELMEAGGRILTEQHGMSWVAGDPRWRMSYRDLVALQGKYPFRAARLNDTVYALEKL